MGEVIRFPDEADISRRGKHVDASSEPATVIILPVVRIERNPDKPSGGVSGSGNDTPRRRRRRSSR